MTHEVVLFPSSKTIETCFVKEKHIKLLPTTQNLNCSSRLAFHRFIASDIQYSTSTYGALSSELALGFTFIPQQLFIQCTVWTRIRVYLKQAAFFCAKVLKNQLVETNSLEVHLSIPYCKILERSMKQSELSFSPWTGLQYDKWY